MPSPLNVFLQYALAQTTDNAGLFGHTSNFTVAEIASTVEAVAGTGGDVSGTITLTEPQIALSAQADAYVAGVQSIDSGYCNDDADS